MPITSIMKHEVVKENVPLSEEAKIPAEPSNCGFLAAVQVDDSEPRASIETLCSLDISSTTPDIVGDAMEAEDSPWGGKQQILRCRAFE